MAKIKVALVNYVLLGLYRRVNTIDLGNQRRTRGETQAPEEITPDNIFRIQRGARLVELWAIA